MSTSAPETVVTDRPVGALAIFLLALTHAELGGIWPVAGGSARFPLRLRGRSRRIVRLVLVAAGRDRGADRGPHDDRVRAALLVRERLDEDQQRYERADRPRDRGGGRPDGALHLINFLGIRKLAHTNSAATWWKVGIPLLTIFVLAIVDFHASNFTVADGFSPFGAKGVLAAVSTSGIIFAQRGFEQADQLAGESARPKRDIPRAVLFSVLIGAVIYIALQVVFLGALPSSQIGHSWAHGAYAQMTGPFAQLATLMGVGWLAGDDRDVVLPEEEARRASR